MRNERRSYDSGFLPDERMTPEEYRARGVKLPTHLKDQVKPDTTTPELRRGHEPMKARGSIKCGGISIPISEGEIVYGTNQIWIGEKKS